MDLAIPWRGRHGGGGRMKNDEMLVTLCHGVHAESVSDRQRFCEDQRWKLSCGSMCRIVEMYNDKGNADY